MMELLQSLTILFIAVGLIFNGLAIRHLIKTTNILREMLVLAMVTR